MSIPISESVARCPFYRALGCSIPQFALSLDVPHITKHLLGFDMPDPRPLNQSPKGQNQLGLAPPPPMHPQVAGIINALLILMKPKELRGRWCRGRVDIWQRTFRNCCQRGGEAREPLESTEEEIVEYFYLKTVADPFPCRVKFCIDYFYFTENKTLSN